MVIQKDFGTDRYVQENNPHWLDEHYDCQIRQYDSPSCSLQDIQSVIMKEIDSKRPVLLNIKTWDGKVAHAVVVDGYREENDHFFVHIVWGANGVGDDWYDFFAPIQIFNNSFRRIVTFKPN